MISIFAKPSFLNVNPHQPFRERTKPVKAGHLMRVSSTIRGDQIAEQIGARLNPESGFENDTCIYVKPYWRKNMEMSFPEKTYIDIVDGHNYGQLLLRHPELKGIVCSRADYRVMSEAVPNELVFIPQHHCNFERARRTRKEVTTVGMIGTRFAIDFVPKKLIKEIEKDFEFKFFSRFFSRQDIIDFYMSIDIQIIWRPYKKILSNPLKMVNASSFGVPTVALDETAFRELRGTYLPVGTPKACLDALDSLRKDTKLYSEYSDRCISASENYHIKKVGEMYKKLDK